MLRGVGMFSNRMRCINSKLFQVSWKSHVDKFMTVCKVCERIKELERANHELQVSWAVMEEFSRAKFEFLADMSH
eukprot:c7188_g1_i1 orf=2-223(-)